MAWTSGGNAYATDGSAWGSANPDLASLEELMNCREAVAQRLTLRLFAPSALLRRTERSSSTWT